MASPFFHHQGLPFATQEPLPIPDDVRDALSYKAMFVGTGAKTENLSSRECALSREQQAHDAAMKRLACIMDDVLTHEQRFAEDRNGSDDVVRTIQGLRRAFLRREIPSVPQMPSWGPSFAPRHSSPSLPLLLKDSNDSTTPQPEAQLQLKVTPNSLYTLTGSRPSLLESPLVPGDDDGDDGNDDNGGDNSAAVVSPRKPLFSSDLFFNHRHYQPMMMMSKQEKITVEDLEHMQQPKPSVYIYGKQREFDAWWRDYCDGVSAALKALDPEYDMLFDAMPSRAERLGPWPSLAMKREFHDNENAMRLCIHFEANCKDLRLASPDSEPFVRSTRELMRRYGLRECRYTDICDQEKLYATFLQLFERQRQILQMYLDFAPARLPKDIAFGSARFSWDTLGNCRTAEMQNIFTVVNPSKDRSIRRRKHLSTRKRATFIASDASSHSASQM
jgi:hypothetical protein